MSKNNSTTVKSMQGPNGIRHGIPRNLNGILQFPCGELYLPRFMKPSELAPTCKDCCCHPVENCHDDFCIMTEIQQMEQNSHLRVYDKQKDVFHILFGGSMAYRVTRCDRIFFDYNSTIEIKDDCDSKKMCPECAKFLGY